MLDKQIAGLADATERDAAISAIAEGDPAAAAGVRRWIIAPLAEYIEVEHRRFGRHTEVTEAALQLLLVAEDVADRLTEGDLLPARIDALRARWDEWLVTLGTGYASVKASEGERSRKAGARGGKRSKRQAWADALAACVSKVSDIPDPHSPIEVETDHADFEVYREGGYIYARDVVTGEHVDTSGRRIRPLAESSFIRRYLKK